MQTSIFVTLMTVDVFRQRSSLQTRAARRPNEPLARIAQKVDYIDKATYILIPLFPPKVEQEFVFIEQQNDPDALQTRLKLLLQRDPRVFDFPKITLITSDRGTADLRRHDAHCKIQK